MKDLNHEPDFDPALEQELRKLAPAPVKERLLERMEEAGQVAAGLSVAEFLDNVEGMMNLPPPPPSPGAPTEPTPPPAPVDAELAKLAADHERLRSAHADAQTRMEQLTAEPPSSVFLTGD